MTTALKENSSPLRHSTNTHQNIPVKLENSNDLQIADGQDIDAKTLAKTIKVWKTILNERLAETRGADATTPSPLTALALTSDRQTVADYIELADRFTYYLTGQTEKPIIRVARDKQNTIQGLSCASIQGKTLYIHHIFTAPWNLKMYGKTAVEHQSLITKGCGTALITSCYQAGLQQGCTELRLKALTGSMSFYKDYLKMEQDKENNSEFFFPLTSGRTSPTASSHIKANQTHTVYSPQKEN